MLAGFFFAMGGKFYKDLSDREKRAVAEELMMPVGEMFSAVLMVSLLVLIWLL
jgi:hypothetical protein